MKSSETLMFRLVKVFRPCRNTNGHLGGDGPEDDEVAELLQIGPALNTPFNKTAQHPV